MKIIRGIVSVVLPILQIFRKTPATILVTGLLGLASVALTTAFSADLQLKASAVTESFSFDLVYQNGPSAWAGSSIFACLVGVSIWFVYRTLSPRRPKSELIADLEDFYDARGNRESVCQRFKEAYLVTVYPDELDDLMKGQKLSLRAAWLKNSRAHVAYNETRGFVLISQRYPHKHLKLFFGGIFFLSGMATLLPIALSTAAIALGKLEIAAQFGVGVFACGSIAWVALSGCAASSGALSLTESSCRPLIGPPNSMEAANAMELEDRNESEKTEKPQDRLA